MTATYRGPKTWSGSRDEDGHRTWKLTCLVQCDDKNDGPSVVMACPGLPQIGNPWLIGNDNDPWAFITPAVNITAVVSEEPFYWYEVEFTATTKPWGRDQTNPVGDPTLEPPQITYTFVKTTVEATEDRWGFPIYNSAWEKVKGKQIEFDTGTLSVRIVQNLATVDIAVLVQCFQTVNESAMWGMPPRTIKLSEAQVERKYYANLLVYHTRSLTFECNFNGWDRDLMDEGTKVLYGRYAFLDGSPTPPPSPPTGAPPRPADPIMWLKLDIDEHGTKPDKANPSHFVTYVDRSGNPGRVILNGEGIPAGTTAISEQRYCCVITATVNIPPDNGGWWVPIGGLNKFPVYDPLRNYPRGSLVTSSTGDKYVAVGFATTPPNTTDVLVWCQLPAGLSDKGVYNPATTYGLGDYVRSTSKVGPGWIHVEKYHESDFVTFLGIPDPLP